MTAIAICADRIADMRIEDIATTSMYSITAVPNTLPMDKAALDSMKVQLARQRRADFENGYPEFPVFLRNPIPAMVSPKLFRKDYSPGRAHHTSASSMGKDIEVVIIHRNCSISAKEMIQLEN